MPVRSSTLRVVNNLVMACVVVLARHRSGVAHRVRGGGRSLQLKGMFEPLSGNQRTPIEVHYMFDRRAAPLAVDAVCLRLFIELTKRLQFVQFNICMDSEPHHSAPSRGRFWRGFLFALIARAPTLELTMIRPNDSRLVSATVFIRQTSLRRCSLRRSATAAANRACARSSNRERKNDAR